MATTIIRYRSGKAWSQKQIENTVLLDALEDFSWVVLTHKKGRIGDISINGVSTTKDALVDQYIKLMQAELTMFE